MFGNSVHGILAYCRINEIDGHYLFKDHNLSTFKGVNIEKLNSDGHQHYIANSDEFVTDTYPDNRRYAKLIKVNIKTSEIEIIANIKSAKKFQSPSAFKHWACDLHPRVSNDGKIVCFDSVHTGKRALCFIKMD